MSDETPAAYLRARAALLRRQAAEREQRDEPGDRDISAADLATANDFDQAAARLEGVGNE